jgi:hypothetical protein
MMRPFQMVILAVIALSGCGRSSKTSTVPARPPLPVVAISDVPAPASPTVTVEKGSNLRAIGAGAYGHERFSGFVARVNGIEDPEKVIAGTILKTPSLAQAFQNAGLDSRYQPAINALAKACTDFHDAMPAYLKAREASGVSHGSFAIPKESREAFLKCADAIDAANFELKAVKAPHQVPHKTIDQFAEAARLVRELATGSIDGYGYDYDLPGQRFGLAFTNAMVWTQEHYR